MKSVDRNPSIELLRIILMFGICMCHSVGAGGHIWSPLRNVCMMCTVGFIFITGWYGIRFSIGRVARLLGMAAFAQIVVIVESYFLHGTLTAGIFHQLYQWWFLNAYLELMILSPILNSLVTCLQSSDLHVRREACVSAALFAATIYGLSWPMHCHWIPQIRFFLTLGCPCQFGTICVIYLLARYLNVSGAVRKMKPGVYWIAIVVSVGLAMFSYKFSYYNSPFAFLFAFSLFCVFLRFSVVSKCCIRIISFITPSLFFIYLFHSHGDPGFVLIEKFQTWLIGKGAPIPIGWVVTAFVIFMTGILLDSIRRGALVGVRAAWKRWRKELA